MHNTARTRKEMKKDAYIVPEEAKTKSKSRAHPIKGTRKEKRVKRKYQNKKSER